MDIMSVSMFLLALSVSNPHKAVEVIAAWNKRILTASTALQRRSNGTTMKNARHDLRMRCRAVFPPACRNESSVDRTAISWTRGICCRGPRSTQHAQAQGLANFAIWLSFSRTGMSSAKRARQDGARTLFTGPLNYTSVRERIDAACNREAEKRKELRDKHGRRLRRSTDRRPPANLPNDALPVCFC